MKLEQRGSMLLTLNYMLLKFKSNIISRKVGYFGAHALQF